jgi:hypothetical protein
MDLQASVIDSDTLREQLMAPDPMQRAIALHALEVEVVRGATGARGALVHEVEKFTARGIPFYSLHDPHFRNWVGKAVAYWQKLRAADAKVQAA